MKKIFISLALAFASFCSINAQNVTVKAGTVVPLQVVNPVQAADVKKGEHVLFQVNRDINVDGVTAIPYGTRVKGQVTEAKKSSWWGTKGRLGIQINEIVMPDGTVIPLTNGKIQVYGKNRTAIAVVAFLFVWPCCFICGSKAELPVGYEIQANVASTVTVAATK